MTVLVVDDEEGVRMVARRILESAGYAVIEAVNGADGLKTIEANTPVDLLMADLDMPVMRGEDMAVRIRALRPHLKCLYVTAHIDALMDERPLLWDGEAFLEKPFGSASLLEAVRLLTTGRIGAPPPPQSSGLRLFWSRISGRS
jgi:CheY-like chemotaxis protein